MKGYKGERIANTTSTRHEDFLKMFTKKDSSSSSLTNAVAYKQKNLYNSKKSPQLPWEPKSNKTDAESEITQS